MPRPLSIPVIERIVTFSCRWKEWVVLVSLLLAVGAGFYTATHFAMNTNSADLISPDVGWRKREQQFDRLFPQQSDLTLVVVDGATPELAEAGASALAARLQPNKNLFLDDHRPDGGAVFDHNGMLFLLLKDVQATTAQLI